MSNALSNLNRVQQIGLALGLILLIIFWNVRLGDMPANGSHALAVVMMTAMFWIFGVMPPAFASLTAVVIITVFKIEKIDVAFSGYVSSAIWLIVFSLIIAKGVEKSGLATRIVTMMMGKMPLSFNGMVGLLIVLCCSTPFFIPSCSASVTLCMTLAVGFMLAVGIDRDPNNKVCAGLTCFIAILTLMAGRAPLTGAMPNFVCVGLVKQISGVEISWLTWLASMWIILPILAIATYFYITRKYQPEIPLSREAIKAQVDKTKGELGPIKPNEIKAAIYVGLAIFLWITDGKIFPAIGTNQIGMLCGTLFLLPYIGTLDLADFKGLSWEAFAFAGGTYSLGVILTTTGFAAWAGTLISSMKYLETASFFTIFVSLMAFTVIIHFFLETLGVVTLLTPIVLKTGLLPPKAVAMIIPYFDGFYIFPFQSTPIIISLSFNTTTWGDIVRYGAFMTVIGILQGLLFGAFYWPHTML